MATRKPPKQILSYLKSPHTFDRDAFETAIRNEVEMSTGNLTASDELLVGSLVISVESMIHAQIMIGEEGHLQQYASGQATSPYFKIRTEMIDKSIKILAELALVARGRPKLTNKVSDVDELFATA